MRCNVTHDEVMVLSRRYKKASQSWCIELNTGEFWKKTCYRLQKTSYWGIHIPAAQQNTKQEARVPQEWVTAKHFHVIEFPRQSRFTSRKRICGKTWKKNSWDKSLWMCNAGGDIQNKTWSCYSSTFWKYCLWRAESISVPLFSDFNL